MLMLTNKIPLRFSKSSEVDMLTGTTVAFYLEDTMGDLPDIRFTDVEDFVEYWKAIEKEFYEVYSEIRQLKIENRELKEQLKTKYIVNKQYEELQRLKEENEQLYELINFANTLIAFKSSESCQMEWEKRLKELQK